MPQVDLARLDLPPHVLARLQALLKAHVPGAEVWAYGSRVRSGAHEGSDLDIVLRRAAPGGEGGGWQNLREALQQSTIPIMIDLHQWEHLPARFQGEIERAYVVLQQGRV